MQVPGLNGHKTGIANAFLALPIVRGQFDAVAVEKLFIKQKSYQGKDKPGSNAYRKAVREKLKALTGSKKVFACPGNCGNCLPSGEHACGSKVIRSNNNWHWGALGCKAN
jgi:hypothetical protein